MTNKIKYGIIKNVNIIHELMLEIAMRQEVGLRLKYLRVMKLLNIPHSKCGGVSLVGWSPTTQTMLLMG